MLVRIGNIHQFTEHHRYYIFRDFSLSSMDFKVIQLIYQPMVGAAAASLYQLLYHQVSSDRVGYSPLSPLRKLFLGLGLEMNEQGRKSLIEQTSRLEAVGLLQSSRLVLPQGDDMIYEYELSAPLAPDEFFENQHLTMYLRDQVGKFGVLALREEFAAKEPDELAQAELNKENISVPFYELFRLNTQVIDSELEQALSEVAPARQPQRAPALETAGIQYGEIILRFPRHSVNRPFVEKLRGDERQMASLNYIAYKYSLNVADLCRLLDEDGLFSASGELLEDELQQRANQIYRQERKREHERQRIIARTTAVPDQEKELPEEQEVLAEDRLDVPETLRGRCDIAQYNMLMRNEPHTRFVLRFFPGAVPEWIERVLERIDLNYRLPGAVINVLIHYVFGMIESQRVSKSFIDAVASNMLVKRVDTFEKAVRYVREQMKLETEKERRKGSPGAAAATEEGSRRQGFPGQTRGRRKPSLPIVQEAGTDSAVTPEELEEMRRLARKLDGKA